MSLRSWNSAFGENREDQFPQQWPSTAPVNLFGPFETSVGPIQRKNENDASLGKRIKEVETRRNDLLASVERDFHKEVWKLNEKCTQEIKILTNRLIACLDDIKDHLVKCEHFEEIIPSWKDRWTANIDEWTCDIRDVNRSLKGNIVVALRTSESSLIDSGKFTTAQVEKFVNAQVTAVNQLIIVNERTYSETERQLKLVFDTLLQKWLTSFSYQMIIASEIEDIANEKAPPEDVKSLVAETVEVVDKIISRLQEKYEEFNQISSLRIYLDHMLVCQEHVKLHLKEALLNLRGHLEQNEYSNEKQYEGLIGELWSDVVKILKEHNDDFRNFSKQAAYAWNQFLRRIHCAELKASISISKARTEKLTKLLKMEEKMNVLLDKLREGNSVANLEHMHNRITRELENAELSCVSCREDADIILRNLIIACFAAYDVYCQQMNILCENSLNTDCDVYCVDDLDDAYELSDVELLRMKYCVFSAQTWMQGMKETLSMLKAELPAFLKILLENIVKVYKGESEFWLMLQLDKITRRKKRIRLNILEIRAAEIALHDAGQTNFELTVDHELKRIQEVVKTIKDDITASDGEVVKYLDQTKTDTLEDTPDKKIKHIKDDALLAAHEETRSQIIRKGKYEMERVYKWLESMCFSYVHSLKLFHEGGNYSTEECEQVLKKISPIVKRLKKSAAKADKKLDLVLTNTRESFKKKLSQIIYPEPSKEALFKAAQQEAIDRFNVNFNRLKEMIKTETYKAIESLKYLKESLATAEQSNSLGKWQNAMNDVQTSCDYFNLSKGFPVLQLSAVVRSARTEHYPSHQQSSVQSNTPSPQQKSKPSRPTSKMSVTQDQPAEKSQVSRKTVNQPSSAIFKKKKLQSPKGSHESGLLFAKVTSLNDINYLTNTKNLINEVQARVQIILKEAFEKYHVPLERSDYLWESALATLKHYNLQCESVWTQLFDNFLGILLSLVRNSLAYVLLMKDRHIYNSLKDAIQLESNHRSNLVKLNVKGEKERIDGKLKPWHGYPLNKPLLQSLLKDVAVHCKDQLNSRKTENESYKEQLKSLIAKDKALAIDVLKDAKFFFLELLANPAYQLLLEGIRFYADTQDFGQTTDSARLKKAIQDYCFKGSKKSNLTEPEYKSVLGIEPYDEVGINFLEGYEFWNFSEHMRNILKTLDVLREEFQLPLPNLSSSRDHPEEFWAGEAEIEPLTEETVVPLWLKFEEDMNQHLQKFEEDAIKNLTRAKMEFDAVAGDLIRWKDEWISNIKEVNRLYLINPILEQPPKKIASDPAEYLKTATAQKTDQDR